MPKFNLHGPRRTCLITGASSGIGACYAWKLGAELEHNVILVARRADRLDSLAERIQAHHRSRGAESLPWVRSFSCDLVAASAREALFQYLPTLPSSIDVLVNNAGFGSLGNFSESDEPRQLQMVALNCEVPLILMRRLLPQFTSRGEGLVINVASTGAFQPLTYMSTYGATKAFLCSLSVALAAEVGPQGVLVLAHCPGPTSTEFHIAAGLPAKIDLLNSMTVERVVSQALRGAERGRTLVVNGAINSFLSQLSRMLPPPFVARVVARMLQPYAELERKKRTS